VYRRSLVRPVPVRSDHPVKGCPLVEEAARKDSAVHVSLSSDSPVKQHGIMAIPPSGRNRRAVEAVKLPTVIGNFVTEYQ
jgi:hypothetical protein